MKIKLFSFFYLLLLIGSYNCYCQEKEIIKPDLKCVGLTFDTLERDFIYEIDAKYKFYSTEDAIVQRNVFYIDSGQDYRNNPSLLYKSDSIFYSFSELGNRYFNNTSCLDHNSIIKFESKTQKAYGGEDFLTKQFSKSSFKSKDDVTYLRFHAKMVVFNLKTVKSYIPKIYSDNCSEEFKSFQFCSKLFGNTFQIVSVLSFQYSYDYYQKSLK